MANAHINIFFVLCKVRYSAQRKLRESGKVIMTFVEIKLYDLYRAGEIGIGFDRYSSSPVALSVWPKTGRSHNNGFNSNYLNALLIAPLFNSGYIPKLKALDRFSILQQIVKKDMNKGKTNCARMFFTLLRGLLKFTTLFLVTLTSFVCKNLPLGTALVHTCSDIKEILIISCLTGLGLIQTVELTCLFEWPNKRLLLIKKTYLILRLTHFALFGSKFYAVGHKAVIVGTGIAVRTKGICRCMHFANSLKEAYLRVFKPPGTLKGFISVFTLGAEKRHLNQTIRITKYYSCTYNFPMGNLHFEFIHILLPFVVNTF
ncbi:hypothetical protein EGR_10526 [Echinococcus granulosus]|uniref:Uncharacterized protein n=1 Tax=Echinococcus granulosus TaxID=6210 RepID=W6UM98_ECHGR|nr:hypothetical protein EGR_10526 [Echinococcus granulosus]EUB54619.1 hypothetical protein EGR_10526 [Echinococcus granulosus]